MARITNPKILRIRETKDWLSRGFYQKNFSQYLEEDFLIRKFLNKKLPSATIQNIEIERGQSSLKIIIKTARPALVIGRGGKGVEELKREVERTLFKNKQRKNLIQPKKEIRIEILEIKNPWTSASLVAQWVANQIEKMVRYRRVLKMGISRVMAQREAKGTRIEVAGRLNGVEIARTEWLQQGRLPRQNLRSVIDYGFTEAHCTYGTIGVKVWIYKGEEFE